MSTTKQGLEDQPKNMTWLLFMDELRGFAKSAIMISMWVGLPLMGLGLYFALPDRMPVNTFTEDKFALPSSSFLSIMLSSIAGMLASAMVSVEIVNEKNKKVYDLFFIRPINRGSFMWAKFFAVAFCTSVAVIFSMLSGLIVDLLRGVPIGPLMLESIFNSTLSAIGVVIVSTAAGVLIGMLSKTVMLAVMLVIFAVQYVMLIPALAAMLPMFDEYIPTDWISAAIYLITLILTVAMMLISSFIFKRMEV